MAYKIDKGVVVPNDDANKPIVEEEQVVLPESNSSGLHGIFPKRNKLHLVKNEPSEVLGSMAVHALPLGTQPINPNIVIGTKVVRRIRPHDIGLVESITLNKDNVIQTVWVVFEGKTGLPYEPVDLAQITVN